MKQFVFFAVLILISNFSFAQFPNTDSSYFFLYGGSNTDEFRDACNHSIDSGYAMIGSTSSYSGQGSDIFVVKADWKGNTIWSRNIGGIGMEKGSSIKETYDHGFIIGGITNSNTNNDYNMLLIKTDQQGFVQWQKTYGGNDWDFLYCVVQAPDSGYVLAGETYSFGNQSSNIYIIRTDKNGDTLWTRNYGGAGKDAINKIIFTSDSNLVGVGYSESNSLGLKDLCLIKFNFISGDTIFSRRFGGAYNDEASAVVEHEMLDSGYVIVGYTESFTTAHDKDILIIKYSKNGNQLWEHHFGNNGGNDEATCIYKQGIDFFVSGYTANGAGAYDLAAGVVDLFGNWQWNQSTSYGSYEEDFAWSNIKSLRGDYIFAGSTKSFGANDQDAMIILVDSIKFQFQSINLGTDSLVGVKENKKNLIEYFPNPASNFIRLNLNSIQSKEMKIIISDLTGKIILEDFIDTNNIEINVSGLNSGVYNLSIVNKGSIYRQKLSIVH